MKTWAKKSVLVIAALVIAFGTAAMISGCKKKATPATPPAKKAAEKETE